MDYNKFHLCSTNCCSIRIQTICPHVLSSWNSSWRKSIIAKCQNLTPIKFGIFKYAAHFNFFRSNKNIIINFLIWLNQITRWLRKLWNKITKSACDSSHKNKSAQLLNLWFYSIKIHFIIFFFSLGINRVSVSMRLE